VAKANQPPPITVLIVDDQVLFCKSLQIVLDNSSEGRIRVLGVAFSAQQCLDFLRSQKPDLILMDVRMPGTDGVETCRKVHELYPSVKVMMLTTFDDDAYASSALLAGAMGYVIKNIAPEELILFIESVNQGTMIVSPSVGRKIFVTAPTSADLEKPDEVQVKKLNYLRTRFPTLKKRDIEVLFLVLKGLSNTQIAQALYISEHTVRNYTSSIYAKIGVDDRLHAIQLLSILD